MNKVIIIGRFVKDAETKKTENTTISRFTIAVDRRKEGADFINCVAFGKTAEFISKYFSKGNKIVIEGRIQTGSYEKDGVKHYTTDIIVESAEFGESKKNKEESEWQAIPEQISLPFE